MSKKEWLRYVVFVVEKENYVPSIAETEIKEGTMKLVRIEGVPVLFIKQKGKIYVIDDRCPHMGCRFSGGSLEDDIIICPCHEWHFNIVSGEYQEMPDYKLVTYPFKIVDGKIWVRLDETF